MVCILHFLRAAAFVGMALRIFPCWQHWLKFNAANRPVTSSAGSPAEPSDLPDHVVLRMLHREVLLTQAKLHALNYEQAVAERKLRTLKSQLRQVILRYPVHGDLCYGCLIPKSLANL